MNPLKSKNLSSLHLFMRSLSAVCLKGHLAYYFTLQQVRWNKGIHFCEKNVIESLEERLAD